MSEQNAVRNELSLAQENAALRSRVAVLEEELALIREQLAWLKKTGFRTQNRAILRYHGFLAALSVPGRAEASGTAKS